jgi:alkylhydroperoxidase/carboxymuconolactone decarboxylase family protein YurZ
VTDWSTDELERVGAPRSCRSPPAVAPALVALTDDVLFGQVWARAELTSKERGLITVATLLTTGSTEPLVFHLRLVKDNGATETELIEAITHLAFRLAQDHVGHDRRQADLPRHPAAPRTRRYILRGAVHHALGTSALRNVTTLRSFNPPRPSSASRRLACAGRRQDPAAALTVHT